MDTQAEKHRTTAFQLISHPNILCVISLACVGYGQFVLVNLRVHPIRIISAAATICVI
jgi:hypothetical protein